MSKITVDEIERATEDPLEGAALTLKARHKAKSGAWAEQLRGQLMLELAATPRAAELLVDHFLFTRVQMLEGWDGKIPTPLTGRDARDLAKAARRCASSLRSIPKGIRFSIALLQRDVEIGGTIERLDAIAEYFAQYAKRNLERAGFKKSIEDYVAFVLLTHAIPLRNYGEGVLARTLRAIYTALDMEVGADPRRVLRRLSAYVSPEDVPDARGCAGVMWLDEFLDRYVEHYKVETDDDWKKLAALLDSERQHRRALEKSTTLSAPGGVGRDEES